MTAALASRAATLGQGLNFSGILLLALRELRGGLRGFYIFIACVALGVTVITGVSALSDALRAGLERQGETILGGDATFARMHARITDTERSWIAKRGRISETATMRTMARLVDGSDGALAELKAVDGAYPLVGALKLSTGATTDQVLHAGLSAAADPILLERLGIKAGDKIKVGEAEVTVAAAINAEPDGIADRVTFGPRVLVSLETLEATKLVQPGTLIRWRYALKLPDNAGEDERNLASVRDALKADLPDAGFTVADRRDPSPQVRRTLERLRQFLTLIGLTALLVGGVGVANAVATFIDRRRKDIATFKSVGATSRTVFIILLVQVMLMAAAGVLIGLVLGYLVPVFLNAAYGAVLPIRAEVAISAGSIFSAAAYGFLVAALFTLWPLGRAELVSAAVLFRDEAADKRVWPRPMVIGATVLVAAVLAALAIFTSDSQRIAIYFVAGLVLVFAVFLAVGTLIPWAARRLPRPRWPELALAVGNLGAPGGLTRSVTLSLGAGLSLLVAVALADASLVKELTTRLPKQSPNYFLLDIPKADYPAIVEIVRREVPGAAVEEAPMLRGRLVRLGDRLVEQIKAPPEAEWVLTGDRGLTYSETVPEGSKVVTGEWWQPGYSGEPLVSFEADLAKHLGVGVGDSVTVNVLGRNVTARIANLRTVDWESLAINFVMVFSPNTLAAAPHNLLATVVLPAATPLADEARVARVLGQVYPAVTAIRVKDAINAFGEVFAKVMIAVRVAGGVTLLAGALVLAGALATAQRRRIAESVILKVLGATRWRILTAHAIEYVLLAAVTAVFAIGLGSLAAWVALEKVMDVPFAFSWTAVSQALALATACVLIFGGLGTWQVLKARPVPYLRAE